MVRTVGDLHSLVELLPSDYVGVGISEVYSWRGEYDKPAFSIEDNVSKSDMRKVINTCLTETFCGYKGGEFTYDFDSECGFDDWGYWSEGEYLLKKCVKHADSLFIQRLVGEEL